MRTSLETALRRSGYAVDSVEDGRKGLLYARTTEYDIIVLDIMLPEVDGLQVLRHLRSHACDAAVLMLTARDSIQDRVEGLRQGADDYLVKPFALDELIARVGALARRRHGSRSAVVRVDDLEVDRTRRVVRRGGRTIELKPREYAILDYLAHKAGQPVSRHELEEHVYDEHSQVQSNAIDSAICTLRAKLSVGASRPLIHTRRGVGYVLSYGEEPA